MSTIFIVLQVSLLFFMLFHDWISIPPFNDIAALQRADSRFYRLLGSVINGAFVLIPLILTIEFYDAANNQITSPANIIIFIFYFILTIGTILSWWVPYFFGSSKKHKAAFAKFSNTHHFLAPREDHVVPNTLHVILHLQVWICWLIAIYFL